MTSVGIKKKAPFIEGAFSSVERDVISFGDQIVERSIEMIVGSVGSYQIAIIGDIINMRIVLQELSAGPFAILESDQKLGAVRQVDIGAISIMKIDITNVAFFVDIDLDRIVENIENVLGLYRDGLKIDHIILLICSKKD